MIKLLLGGSPCTYWSIAQSTDKRETEPSGMGWELFKNYLIAGDKYNPDYFLYENNYSMDNKIRDEITKQLGVEPIMINSALVSAQNRKRYYWTNIPNVTQPEDKGIFLKDILESGIDLTQQEKSYCLTSSYNGAVAWNTIERNQRTMAAEPVCVAQRGRYSDTGTRNGSLIYKVKDGKITIKNKTYSIKLPDGCYIIRKLTVTEYKRLQTVPDDYRMPCSITQNYKMLGNGWTVDVISHILSHISDITKSDVEVLSMYDGMSCGHIALDKIGANVINYYATEIDKYAIKTTFANYPKTIFLGDAFNVRKNDFSMEPIKINKNEIRIVSGEQLSLF